MKNYDEEQESFIKMIGPHVEPGIVGHQHYEEADAPTPLRATGTKIVWEWKAGVS
jgi:hypothetical protein